MNSANSSPSEPVVGLCGITTVQDMCGYPVWKDIVLAVHTISILVNIVHYITLQAAPKTSEVSQVNSSAWQKLLSQLAITDVDFQA